MEKKAKLPADDQKLHKKRMRDRFIRNGLDGFHDYEVLELILSYSIVRKDTRGLAKNLIRRFGSLTDVLNAPVRQLTEVEGLGERSAVLLKLLRDANVYHLRETILHRDYISGAEDIIQYLKTHYKGMKTEEFKVIYLNTQNMIITDETLFYGTLNHSAIYIRKIVEHALMHHAHAVILVHNHPGGNMVPSSDDILITKRIQDALALVEIEVLDHILVGHDKYLSFIKKARRYRESI